MLIQSQIIMQKCKNAPNYVAFQKRRDRMSIFLYLQVKKLKDLEREKDLLWMGLHALEQVRERLCSKPEDNSSKKEIQEFPDTPTLLLAQIHRVNRALRNLLCDSRNPTNPAQGRPSMEGYVLKQKCMPNHCKRSCSIFNFLVNYWSQCIESHLPFYQVLKDICPLLPVQKKVLVFDQLFILMSCTGFCAFRIYSSLSGLKSFYVQ